MARVVVKVTGKLFDRGNSELIKGFANVVLRYVDRGNNIAIVVGGGPIARSYIELGRELGLSNAVLDLLGIESARLNALLLASLLGKYAYLPIPRSIDEFMEAWSTGKVVVLGGLQPGQSTNAVAAIIAEVINADLLVNATNVDGVYDKDPSKYPNARLLREVTVDELERVLTYQEVLPGKYELFDKVALSIIRRSNISTVFVNAFKLDQVEKALNGERNVGTWLVFK